MSELLFEVSLKQGSRVTIGDDLDSEPNEITVEVANKGEDAKLSLALVAGCDHSESALLAPGDVPVTATWTVPATAGNVTSTTTKDAVSTYSDAKMKGEWSTDVRGTRIGKGQTLSLTLRNFRSDTQPGTAQIQAVVRASAPGGKVRNTAPILDKTLQIEKTRRTVVIDGCKVAKPCIHFFTVSKPFLVQTGHESVQMSFNTSGFSSVTLERNNREAYAWLQLPIDKDPTRTIKPAEALTEHPSITTVYTLRAKTAGGTEQTLSRTVQVVAPGWNQIAMPQGYATTLLVAPAEGKDAAGDAADSSGLGRRIYGIFVDGNGRASLYASASGIDDWRIEPTTVEDNAEQAIPPGMETSPAVYFDGRLWLIGGSAFGNNNPLADVWTLDLDRARSPEREWRLMRALTLAEDAKKKDAPRARTGHACLVVPAGLGGKGERLWMMGGHNNKGSVVFSDIWQIDRGDPYRWTRVSEGTGLGQRHLHAAVLHPPNAKTRQSIYMFGGVNQQGKDLLDLIRSEDGKTWDEVDTLDHALGSPLAATLVSASGLGADPRDRLFLAATFKKKQVFKHFSTTSSWMFELHPDDIWEERHVGNGWDRFGIGEFGMRAIAFNGLLFVWSLTETANPGAPPRLNILVP